MPTAPVQPTLLDRPVRRRLPLDPWVPALVLIALLVVALLAPTLKSGPFVDGVTFTNSSRYSYEVAVSASPDGPTTILGNAAAKGSTTVPDVFDESSSWTFRFSTQDREVGQIVMSRDDLAAGGWTVDVPERFAAALAGAGVVPTD